MAGDDTFQEILEQPAVWQRVLDALQPQLDALALPELDELVFVGCGSSYHLAEIAAKVFAEVVGVRTRFVPASELLLATATVLHAGDRLGLVALSRTGTTSEVLKAVELFKRRREQGAVTGFVYGFTCAADSALVHACDRSVIVPSQERSLVTTQAFSGTLLALELWAASHDRQGTLAGLSALDAAGRAALERASLLREIASYGQIERFVLLGTGVLHAMAEEGALKLQEMAGAWAESYHALEVRHGPRATIGEGTLVVLLASARGGAYELPLVGELRAQGARILVLAGEEASEFQPPADYAFGVGPYPDAIRALLYAPLLHLLAYHRAMLNGRDPDRPVHLSRSVIL